MNRSHGIRKGKIAGVVAKERRSGSWLWIMKSLFKVRVTTGSCKAVPEFSDLAVAIDDDQADIGSPAA